MYLTWQIPSVRTMPVADHGVASCSPHHAPSVQAYHMINRFQGDVDWLHGSCTCITSVTQPLAHKHSSIHSQAPAHLY